MSEHERRKREGASPKGAGYVSGPGGPTMTQGGIMPGGPEMDSWKRPLKPEVQDDLDEMPIEEQAENLRRRVDQQ